MRCVKSKEHPCLNENLNQGVALTSSGEESV
jgi:hypothetical protein